MILPGFPRVMGSAAKAPPFVLSGTFATDFDGWISTGMSWINSNFNFKRTDPGGVNGSAGSRIEYTIPAPMAVGLTISASIWHRANSNSNTPTRRMAYRYGGGSETVIATVTDGSETFTLMSGSFDFSGSADLKIIIEVVGGAGNGRFDDWSISGA